MTKDFIGYKAFTDAALRGVVRDALKHVEQHGLVGAHHFRLSFRTHFPGVEIPDFLLEQYPEEMTIILQHQFWGLKVKENHFEVTLSFRKLPATLAIPFGALTAFVDPGVQFGLSFQSEPEGDTAQRNRASLQKPQAAVAPESKEPVRGDPPVPGEVVSLDSFRKK
ncbi:MAG TPA: ClpXP protease specificity-enhancing factor SspB [Rhizomicrobium sp.]|jgi:hypothetical protein